jgi:rRNA-processing protein FCF1
MLEAVLDTNFLMLAHQFKIDILSELSELLGEHRAVTCEGVIEELRKIGSGKGRDSAAARYALKLLKLREVEIKRNAKEVDEWILSYCVRSGAVACTVDRELISKLKKEGVKVVILRGKACLQFA